jgi:chloride channel protein, CIC family
MELPRHRLAILSLVGALLGVLGGLAAFVLIRAIGLLTNLGFFHRVAWGIPSFRHLQPSLSIPAVAVVGGLVVAVLARWCPMIKGHGIPEAMDAVLTKQSRISPRAAVAKPVSAAVAIGTGGPFGAEGPIIVTGGALGSLLGQLFRTSPAERKILLASGAAAGMAATFGTPLAAVVLAIELLLFEFSTRVLIPLVVAAAVAGGMHALFFGPGTLLTAPAHGDLGLAVLPLFAVLGLACGGLAVVITKGLEWVEEAFERLPIHPFWFPALGALAFGLIGLWQPRALSVGYDVIDDVVLGRLALGAVAAIAVAKLLAWWLALGSGTSGGTLAPMLLIGGAFGAVCGAAVVRVIPGASAPATAFALVAMAAVFAAATRAPFASMVFVFELTRDFGIVVPLMIATVLACLVYDAVLRESLLTAKLARRGVPVRPQLGVDPMRATLVRDVMTREVVTVSEGVTVAEARAIFRSAGHSAYPIVARDGTTVGIVTRGDLLADGVADGDRVRDVAATEVVAVAPSDPLERAVDVMLEEGVEHVPVFEGGALRGIVTRTDLLTARDMVRGHERRQPGWLAALR